MKSIPEPKIEDLILDDFEIIVIWYSGDWRDRPAIMSIKEFCEHWCPKKFNIKEELIENK